jgi:5-methylcytosine-specific restriction endonuclease McrA
MSDSTKYQRLLLDRRWQRKRLLIFNDAGWKCEKCGNAQDEIPLHAHHRIYVTGRMPWQYDRDDLAALCDHCHAEEHGKRQTDGMLLTLQQQIERAHSLGQWDEMRRLSELAQTFIDNGAYYRGLF